MIDHPVNSANFRRDVTCNGRVELYGKFLGPNLKYSLINENIGDTGAVDVKEFSASKIERDNQILFLE